MIAQDPQVAGLCDRIIRRCGDVVRIRKTVRNVAAEQFRQLVVREAGKTQIEVQLVEFGQFKWQQLLVPV